MFSKKNKAVNPKTQEQMLRDLQQNAEFIAKMKFIKEQFYPTLIEATTSIEDATQNLTILNSFMMEGFLARMKEVKFGELHMEDKLMKGEKYEQLKTLLELFNEMSVFEAKEYLEGMKNEINLFLNEEQKIRPLSDLKTKWADEL